MIQALYIHIPFCVQRCAYCDFSTSACNDAAAMDAYVVALSMQLRRASRAGLLGGVRTIYIGGGTPTHLGTRRLSSLVYLVSLSVNLENVDEFTLECNPESLTGAMLKDLFALGVDRFSIGVQSFDDALLGAYGRAHGAQDAHEAIRAVGERARNWSVDLMCGGPGQTLAGWERDVRTAIELGAPHVSVYPLTVEDGTPLARAVDAGEWPGPDEDLQADMMERAAELLGAAGLERYEVASYARPGRQSRHNTAYWTGVEYLGLGAAASSMLGAESLDACLHAGIFEAGAKRGWRTRVAACADAGAFAASDGKPQVEAEALTRAEAALEDLMLGMRRSEGVAAADVEEADALVPGVRGAFAELERKGLVRAEGPRVKSTRRGWLMGNELYGAIWALAEGL